MRYLGSCARTYVSLLTRRTRHELSCLAGTRVRLTEACLLDSRDRNRTRSRRGQLSPCDPRCGGLCGRKHRNRANRARLIRAGVTRNVRREIANRTRLVPINRGAGTPPRSLHTHPLPSFFPATPPPPRSELRHRTTPEHMSHRSPEHIAPPPDTRNSGTPRASSPRVAVAIFGEFLARDFAYERVHPLR